MAIQDNINTLEKAKFVKTGKNKIASRSETHLPVSTRLIARKTPITTSKTEIIFPDVGSHFEIYHNEAGVNVWISNLEDVAVNGENSLALPAGKSILIEIKQGEQPDIYGIVSTGTVQIFVYGAIKE